MTSAERRAKPDMKTKESLTADQCVSAESHVRFALNAIETVLIALGTTVNDARVDPSVQPETEAALVKVAKALDRAFVVVRRERMAACKALTKRLLRSQIRSRGAKD